jgi:hypothetical protein
MCARGQKRGNAATGSNKDNDQQQNNRSTGRMLLCTTIQQPTTACQHDLNLEQQTNNQQQVTQHGKKEKQKQSVSSMYPPKLGLLVSWADYPNSEWYTGCPKHETTRTFKKNKKILH